MLLWPSNSWTYRISVPFSSKCIAKLCRSEWNVAFLIIPARIQAHSKIFCALLVDKLPLLSDKKMKSVGNRPLVIARRSFSNFVESSVIRSLLPSPNRNNPFLKRNITNSKRNDLAHPKSCAVSKRKQRAMFQILCKLQNFHNLRMWKHCW